VTLSWMQSAPISGRTVSFNRTKPSGTIVTSRVEWMPAGIMMMNDALRLR